MGLVRKSCGRLDLVAHHLGMPPREDVRRTGFRRTAPHDATDLSLVEWCAYGSGPSVAGVLVLPPGWLSAGRALPERRPGTGRLDTTDRRRLSGWHWKSGPCCSVFAGLPVAAADFTPALDAWLRGEDPLDQPVPLHASYEDKPGAPNRARLGFHPSWPPGRWTPGGACWSGYARGSPPPPPHPIARCRGECLA